MSFEEAAKLTRSGAMTEEQIQQWQIQQPIETPDQEYDDGVANSCGTCGVRASLCECPSDNSSSDEGPEDMVWQEEEDEEAEEEMPLDLAWYFDQFELDAKARIRLCSTYASVLRAQIAFQTSPKKRKIIDLTKD